MPVLIADAERGLVAAAHAGRPGLVAGVVPAVVAQLRVRGARSMVAWLGPHVCGSCYEVPEAMRAEVAEVSPESFATTSWGTPAVDIAAGVTAQLLADGIEVVDLDDAARCTIEDDDLFSYRRQGAAVRPARRCDPGAAVNDCTRRARRAGPAPRRGARVGSPVPARLQAARRGGHVDGGDQVLPRLRRTPAGGARCHARRGEPPPGGARPRRRACAASTSAGTSSVSLQSKKAAAVARLRGRGRVGRPGQGARRPRSWRPGARRRRRLPGAGQPRRGRRGGLAARRCGTRRRTSPGRAGRGRPRACGCGA